MRAPARRYKWADAQPGNFLNLRHGAWSPRKVEPLAAELVEEMRPLVDWWQPADMPMVWRWARVEAKCQLLAEWLASKVDVADDGTVRPGDIDQDGNVRPAADLLARLEAQASGLASKLGLEPTSRARLGRDVAASRVDLARLWAAEAADEAGMDDDTSEADTAAAAGVERAEVAE